LADVLVISKVFASGFQVLLISWTSYYVVSKIIGTSVICRKCKVSVAQGSADIPIAYLMSLEQILFMKLRLLISKLRNNLFVRCYS